MSDASAIGYVSQGLQALLRAFITNHNGPFKGKEIDLRSPREVSAVGDNPTLISLWLYRVRRHDDLVNLPPVLRPDGRLELRPLPLNLHYLVTPFAPDALDRQRLLGLAMQALNDHPRLTAEFLQPQLLEEPPAGLGIHLEPQSLEESAKIWHALHEPYRLSAPYLVQYVPIPSAVSRKGGPAVLDKRVDAGSIERVS